MEKKWSVISNDRHVSSMNIVLSLMVDLYVYVVSSLLFFFNQYEYYIVTMGYLDSYLFVRARTMQLHSIYRYIKKDSVIYMKQRDRDIMIVGVCYARKEWHISLANDHNRHRHYPYCLNECCCCCCHQKDYRSLLLRFVCHRFYFMSMCIDGC
jgi:hypothetical protein